jgi:hypothetical protein
MHAHWYDGADFPCSEIEATAAGIGVMTKGVVALCRAYFLEKNAGNVKLNIPSVK